MTFFDYAKNHTNKAEAAAVARARRDAIEDKTAWRIEWTNRDQSKSYWNGAPYDVISLARDFHRNGTQATVISQRGELLDMDSVRY